MNRQNNQKMRGNGTSRRFRMKYASTAGIIVYAPQIAASATMWTHPCRGVQVPQVQRGGKSEVSNNPVIPVIMTGSSGITGLCADRASGRGTQTPAPGFVAGAA
ncbi:MAG: hypothetical protein AMXMBFR22_00740 [Phycisphaerae bacterium]